MNRARPATFFVPSAAGRGLVRKEGRRRIRWYVGDGVVPDGPFGTWRPESESVARFPLLAGSCRKLCDVAGNGRLLDYRRACSTAYEPYGSSGAHGRAEGFAGRQALLGT